MNCRRFCLLAPWVCVWNISGTAERICANYFLHGRRVWSLARTSCVWQLSNKRICMWWCDDEESVKLLLNSNAYLVLAVHVLRISSEKVPRITYLLLWMRMSLFYRCQIIRQCRFVGVRRSQWRSWHSGPARPGRHVDDGRARQVEHCHLRVAVLQLLSRQNSRSVAARQSAQIK